MLLYLESTVRIYRSHYHKGHACFPFLHETGVLQQKLVSNAQFDARYMYPLN